MFYMFGSWNSFHLPLGLALYMSISRSVSTCIYNFTLKLRKGDEKSPMVTDVGCKLCIHFILECTGACMHMYICKKNSFSE